MFFRFDFEGDTLVQRRLLRIGIRALDARPAFREVADLWMESERQLFATEGASAGRPWAPLAEATLEQKARDGQPSAINQATRSLLYALTQKGDPNQILEIEPGSLTLGAALPQARFAQRGTTHMPARPPMMFDEPVKRQTVKIIQRFLVTGDVGRSA